MHCKRREMYFASLEMHFAPPELNFEPFWGDSSGLRRCSEGVAQPPEGLPRHSAPPGEHSITSPLRNLLPPHPVRQGDSGPHTGPRGDETMDAQTDTPGRQAILGLLRAPIELRSYRNLLYLLLAFPLGLTYFLFLVVGLSLGLGLTIIWVGLPVLLLVLLGSRALSALERQLAIGLLGAEVPPMAPPAAGP